MESTFKMYSKYICHLYHCRPKPSQDHLLPELLQQPPNRIPYVSWIQQSDIFFEMSIFWKSIREWGENM